MTTNQYEEDELLPLSGIQHFSYCQRQWGLIHIEQQWVENLHTAKGRILHEKVDDPYWIESRNALKVIRSVPLLSKTLGLYGFADVIEIFKRDQNSLAHSYNIVEYKKGKPKLDDRDEVQLCAQAICLEEMLAISLDYGHMYYGQTKHRLKVEFSQILRTRVITLANRMHELFAKGETPSAIKSKRCKNCSMVDICVPKLQNAHNRLPKYMAFVFEEIAKE